jgi:hypothetical protein
LIAASGFGSAARAAAAAKQASAPTRAFLRANVREFAKRKDGPLQ